MSTFIDFAEIKQQTSIEQVAAWLQIRLEKTGNQLRGCCPIHQGTNKRDFIITPAKGLFYCFKCKEGGDLIQLYARLKGIDPKTAATDIATKIGASDCSAREGEREIVATPSGGEAAETRPQPFQPLSYLLAEHDAVQGLGIAVDTAEHFGSGYAPKGVLRGKIAIPVHDMDGTLLGYAGRSMDVTDIKLTFAKEFDPEPVLFNAHRCESNSIIELRDDPLDVLLAFQNGIENNIVTFLTERISARQIGQLALFLDEKNSSL